MTGGDGDDVLMEEDWQREDEGVGNVVSDENDEKQQVDVDSQDVEVSQQQQESSAAAAGIDDPVSPANKRGEYIDMETPEGYSQHLNSAAGEGEEEALAVSGGLSEELVLPEDEGRMSGEDVEHKLLVPAGDEDDDIIGTDEVTVMSVEDPTLVEVIEVEVPVTSTQDVLLKPDIKSDDKISMADESGPVSAASEGTIPTQVEALNQQSSKATTEPSLPTTRADDDDHKSFADDDDLRKNSIQESSNAEMEAETQNGNELRIQSFHKGSPDAHHLHQDPQSEPKRTEESVMNDTTDDEQAVLKPAKADKVMVDVEGVENIESSPRWRPQQQQISNVEEEETLEEADKKPERGLGEIAYAGLDALTVAIDSVRSQDALAQLQPGAIAVGAGAVKTETTAPGDAVDGRISLDEQRRRDKTELEREMELYEAAEREGEARLLASMRSDQPMPVDTVDSVEEASVKDVVNDRKRASESVLNDARKKRGKRLLTGDETKEEEDVCFICFDGGDLVLCDRRTCPKAYHLNCIGRDAAFFQKKGAWICGWHFCSVCTKPANWQCYTCPTGYCGSCLGQADFLCVRQRKGLCEECYPIVKMIENHETVNAEGVEVDFTDQETYECLFKEYWVDLKSRLGFTPAELDKDAKPAGGTAGLLDVAGSDDFEDKVDPEDYSSESEIEEDEGEDDVGEPLEDTDKKKNQNMKRRARANKGGEIAEKADEGGNETDFGSDEDMMEDAEEEDANEEEDDVGLQPSPKPREFEGWASKELIEFVKYMDEDPKKPLSKFQVTKLLWSYIKSQKLHDPRKKAQIICDDRLRSIFGKKTVGRFEMVKHLPSHFADKGGRIATRQPRDDPMISEGDAGAAAAADADVSPIDEKLSSKLKDVKDRRRRRKAEEEKVERPSVNEFAAVTPKNIGLIYLRRQLLEELLDDPEFESKVCNTFVRIRVPGMINKTEMCYRLVQVAGIRLQAEHYKAGRKVTNIVLEILNLQKREDVTVDLVSNHDFSEEECQRLRQSIKCGFIKTLTVGDIEDKARSLQEAKVNDWFETERQRLTNLRDRASEKGRKRELRECVEKLQELNSPAFRAAKLHARPEVTADPRMDPNYESDGTDDKAIGAEGMSGMLDKSSSPGDKIFSSGSLRTGYNESGKLDWDGQKFRHSSSSVRDSYRGGDVDRALDLHRSGDKLSFGRGGGHHYGAESGNDRALEEIDRGAWRREPQEGGGSGGSSSGAGWIGNGRNRPSVPARWNEKVDLSISVGSGIDARSGRGDYRGVAGMTTPIYDAKAPDWAARRDPTPHQATTPSAVQLGLNAPTPQSALVTQAAIEAAEKEKIWNYMDPQATVQGPFAMEQLRKWNTTGYFPEDLRIWKANQSRDESVLLKDALVGRVQKEREQPWNSTRLGNPVVASIQEEIAQALTTGGSSLSYNSNHPGLKMENGAATASGWAERGGSSGEAGGSSANWSLDGGQGSRSFGRDSVGGSSGQFRDVSSDLKWKPGPAGGGGNWESYGRSTSFNNSPTRNARVDAAARFDPANWASGRSTPSTRSDRDVWGSSPAVNEGGIGGYSKSSGRSSWGGGMSGGSTGGGGGSQYRESGGGWNADESGSRETSRSRSLTRAARKDIPCRFHQKGYCKRGDSCDFWHG